jgi:hypothetical protein
MSIWYDLNNVHQLILTLNLKTSKNDTLFEQFQKSNQEIEETETQLISLTDIYLTAQFLDITNTHILDRSVSSLCRHFNKKWKA